MASSRHASLSLPFSFKHSRYCSLICFGRKAGRGLMLMGNRESPWHGSGNLLGVAACAAASGHSSGRIQRMQPNFTRAVFYGRSCKPQERRMMQRLDRAAAPAAALCRCREPARAPAQAGSAAHHAPTCTPQSGREGTPPSPAAVAGSRERRQRSRPPTCRWRRRLPPPKACLLGVVGAALHRV